MTRAGRNLARIAYDCKAASEPSFDLDRKIWLAVWGDENSNILPYYLPRFSGSLDAAASLVPEGWDWRVGWHRANQHEEGAAFVRLSGEAGWCNAATACLALCAAALEVRCQLANDQVKKSSATTAPAAATPE